MAEHLYKRGTIWWGYVYDQTSGARIARSTKCKDKRAAEAVVREWERVAADPVYAAAHSATLPEAFSRFLSDRTAKGRAEGTVSSYRVKVGHVVRVLGEQTRLASVDARAVDRYIETRLAEGAARYTIQKELVALRGTLKVAKRRGEFSGDIPAIMPNGFDTGYKPRERFLNANEALCLLGELYADHAARVAFILATGARWSESDRALRSDIDWQQGCVRLRGTKTASAARVVPIVGSSHDLLQHAEEYGRGAKGLLFLPWGNVRRDLSTGCKRAALNAIADHLASINRQWKELSAAEQQELKERFAFPPVTPNDLRRTYATWLRQHGVEPHLIGVALGHRDSRMAERVYGRMPVESLGRALAERVGDCSTGVADPVGTQRSRSSGRQLDRANSSRKPVPRDGIEPPTRGFSTVLESITSKRKRKVSSG
jgi:integrase